MSGRIHKITLSSEKKLSDLPFKIGQVIEGNDEKLGCVKGKIIGQKRIDDFNVEISIKSLEYKSKN